MKIKNILFGVVLLIPSIANSALIHETAALGPTGQQGGYPIISNLQWLCTRFTLTKTTNITSVGGHIDAEIRNIFAAIVDLPAPGGLPTFQPFFIDSNAIIGTAFSPASPSSDILVPLAVTLSPGSYGLVFGTGGPGVHGFGTDGEAGMPSNNTPNPSASFFTGRFDTGSIQGEWQNQSLTGARFVIHDNTVIEPPPPEVPLPGALVLFVSGMIMLLGKVALSRTG